MKTKRLTLRINSQKVIDFLDKKKEISGLSYNRIIVSSLYEYISMLEDNKDNNLSKKNEETMYSKEVKKDDDIFKLQTSYDELRNLVLRYVVEANKNDRPTFQYFIDNNTPLDEIKKYYPELSEEDIVDLLSEKNTDESQEE